MFVLIFFFNFLGSLLYLFCVVFFVIGVMSGFIVCVCLLILSFSVVDDFFIVKYDINIFLVVVFFDFVISVLVFFFKL